MDRSTDQSGKRARFRSRRWFIVPIAAAAACSGRVTPPVLAGPSSDEMNASSNPLQPAIELNLQFAMGGGR